MSTGVKIGDAGVVLGSLRPTGYVAVAGERHEAKSIVGPLAAATVVVVVGGDRFGLHVRPAADLPDPAALPGFGEPVGTAVEPPAAAPRVSRSLGPIEWGQIVVFLGVTAIVAAIGWETGGLTGAVVAPFATWAFLAAGRILLELIAHSGL